jgi:glycosyltransferase involved in cell wall biosynthesis
MKISVITVVFNGARTIRDCLESVQQQRYPVEHIIVDGESTDGTLNIIGEYAGKLGRVVSEPDKGIYDAMNKGFCMATGDIVGCLNADDMLAHDDVLRRIATVFADPSVDVCYGDLIYVDACNTSRIIRYWHSGMITERSFRMGLMPAHPTFYIRKTALARVGLFDLEIASANDVEFTLRCLCVYRLKAVYLPEILVKMRTGGVSNRSVRNVIRQNKVILKSIRMHGISPHPLFLLSKFWFKLKQYLVRPTISQD